MPATTAALRREIARINQVIAQIEAKPKAEWQRWQAALGDLRLQRERLQHVVAARRREALKKVIDFRLWREPLVALTQN